MEPPHDEQHANSKPSLVHPQLFEFHGPLLSPLEEPPELQPVHPPPELLPHEPHPLSEPVERVVEPARWWQHPRPLVLPPVPLQEVGEGQQGESVPECPCPHREPPAH